MRYVGWILAVLFAAAGVAGYFLFYAPLKKGYDQQAEEIRMWTAKVEALQGGPIHYDTTPSADTSTPDTAITAPPSTGYGTLLATIAADDMFSSSNLSELTTAGKGELDKLLPTLRTSSGDVFIMVHADNVRVSQSRRDTYPTNWELTARRAAVIARYYLDRDVNYARLVPCGFSAARPAASNSSAEGRTKNRRVEIYLR